jgi:hypothetical protein
MALMCYQFVVSSLMAGFGLKNEFIHRTQITSSMILLADIPLSGCTGYYMGSTLDHVELRPLRALQHYATTWLVYDVLVSLPWHLLLRMTRQAWVQQSTFGNALYAIQLLRWATIHSRPSFLSVASLKQLKYSKREIISFVIFISVHLCLYCLSAMYQ